MASTVRSKVKINDNKLEEVRALWSAEPMDNAALEADISRWLTDMFNGQIRFLREEKERKAPAVYTEV